MVAVVLMALLFAFTTTTNAHHIPYLNASDPCLMSSYATNAANTLAMNWAKFTAPESSQSLYEIYNIFFQNIPQSYFFSTLFVGYPSDGSFFSLSSCSVAITSTVCSQNEYYAGETVFAYSSTTISGSDMLSTFSGKLPINMSDVVNDYVEELTSINATSAWISAVPPFFAGSGATQTYIMLYNGVLFGAVRSPDEPCSTCIQNALNSTGDMAIVSNLANFVSTGSFSDPTTLSDLTNLIFTILYNFVESSTYSMNMITFPTIYYGDSATGSSYLVKDCQRWTSDCPANTTTRYMAWVANIAIFSNLTRQLFEIDPSTSTLRLVDQSGAIYNISTRSWYQARVGWTGSFGAFESPSTIRSYSVPFSGKSVSGVAAVSWYTGEAPQCLFSPQVNACHSASGAPAGAQAVADLYPTLPDISSGYTAVNLACSMMYQAALNLNDTFLVNVFYAKSTGDFVQIKSCASPVYASFEGCDAYDYLCLVVSPTLYGNSLRQVYGFNTVTGLLDGFSSNLFGKTAPTPVAVLPSPYIATMRPYYLQINMPGWSNSTYLFATGGIGESYSVPLSDLAVAAADRIGTEPCTPCITAALNAQQPSIAMLSSVAAFMQGYGSQNGIAAVGAAVTAMFGFVNAYAMKNVPFFGVMLPDVFVGYPNNDTYILEDCRRWTATCYGSTNVTYAAWVRNSATFGDGLLRRFPIVNGAFVNMPFGMTQVDYPTTSRLWYTTKRGWSPAIIAEDNGQEVRTFSTVMPQSAGVAGFPFFTVQAPQCNLTVDQMICHSASYAQPATMAAAQYGMRIPENYSNVAAVCTGLFQATVVNPANSFFRNVYFGLANGDFYMIKSCQNSVDYTTLGCDQAPFTCWVRNQAVFGDQQRHIYLMTMNGTVTTSSSAMGTVGVAAGVYATTMRPWYVQINMPGWSNGTYAFASSGFGESYSQAFQGSNTVGVAAADRMSTEPCDACIGAALIDTQAAARAVTMSAADAMSKVTAPATTMIGAASILRQLFLSAVRGTMAGQAFLDTYVGFNNSDNYFVSDCRRWTSDCPPNASFIGLIRNTAIYGDGNRRMYVLDASGVIQNPNPVSVSATAFMTTTRSWYLTEYGWTDTFFTTYAGLAARSFAYPLSSGMGVASISYFLAAAPQCSVFSPETDMCHFVSYASKTAVAAAAIGATIATPILSIQGIANACQALLSTFLSFNNGFFVNSYVGFPNNDFYMIKYCGAAGASMTTGCITNNYTCWVRNTAVFNTTERLIFAMVQDSPGMYTMHTNGMSSFGALGTSGSPYFPTQRVWYNQINLPGWANATYAFASGGYGESFSAPFAGGVAAADRWGAEPCNMCVLNALMNSPVPRIVASISANMTFPASFDDALAELDNVKSVEYPYPYPFLANYTGANGTFVGSAFINCTVGECAYTKNFFPWSEAVALAQSPSLFGDTRFHSVSISSTAVYVGKGFYGGPWLPNYRGWVPLSVTGDVGTNNASLGWVYVALDPTGNYAYGAYVNSSYMDQACPGLNSYYNFDDYLTATPCNEGTLFDPVTAKCMPLPSKPTCGPNTMYDNMTGTCTAILKYNETMLVDGVCVPNCGGPLSRRSIPQSCSYCNAYTTSTTTTAGGVTSTSTTTTTATGSSTTTTTAAGVTSTSTSTSTTTTTTTTATGSSTTTTTATGTTTTRTGVNSSTTSTTTATGSSTTTTTATGTTTTRTGSSTTTATGTTTTTATGTTTTRTGSSTTTATTRATSTTGTTGTSTTTTTTRSTSTTTATTRATSTTTTGTTGTTGTTTTGPTTTVTTTTTVSTVSVVPSDVYSMIRSTVTVYGVGNTVVSSNYASVTTGIRQLSPMIVSATVVSSSEAASARRSVVGTVIVYVVETLPGNVQVVIELLNNASSSSALADALHNQTAFQGFTLSTVLVSGATVISNPSTTSSGSSGLSSGAIAGIVIGGVVLLTIVVALMVTKCRDSSSRVGSNYQYKHDIQMTANPAYDPHHTFGGESHT